jgi:hypothetical protein
MMQQYSIHKTGKQYVVQAKGKDRLGRYVSPKFGLIRHVSSSSDRLAIPFVPPQNRRRISAPTVFALADTHWALKSPAIMRRSNS